MLTLQRLSYIHPNKDFLFHNISLTVNKQEKIALGGNDGTGKSTLLKIIAGELQYADGQRHVDSESYTCHRFSDSTTICALHRHS